MRSDIAGRPNDQMAAVPIELSGRPRRWDAPFQPWDTAHTRPIDDLIFLVTAMRFGHHILDGQLNGHRLIQVDDATPDLGMLERKRAAQTPQHRMSGIGPI